MNALTAIIKNIKSLMSLLISIQVFQSNVAAGVGLAGCD